MTKIIKSVDTIDYARDETENNAQHEDVLVGWQGKWVKLDMSHAHFTEYDELLGHLLKIGQPVTKDETKRTPAGRRSIAHGGRRSKAYYEGLVEYADRNRITKRDGTGRPAYAGLKPDRNDYPGWLVREYDEYLAKQEASGEQATLAS